MLNQLKPAKTTRMKRKAYTEAEKAAIRAALTKRFGPSLEGKFFDMRAVLK